MHGFHALLAAFFVTACASTPPSPGDSGVLPLAEVNALYDA